MKFYHIVGCILSSLFLTPLAVADTGVNAATQNDKAFAKFGLTGKKVIVAILDRGIDYTHADFRNPDGTTRIRMMWDMSNANPSLALCDPHQPAPIAYTEAQINSALKTGKPLGERDAVGHGTVSTGLAAGNGRAALPISTQWAGLAPEADLVIVKMTSEGAPAHSGQPAESAFQGCMSRALDLATQEAARLGEPIAALMDSGTQWGPIDGTSVVSRKIDADFGSNSSGHVYVAASGDEGFLPNHAHVTYGATPGVFNFTKTSTDPAYFQIWYSGDALARVTLSMKDTGTSVTVLPGSHCASSADSSITLCTYLPGQQFYPWTSSGADRAVWVNINGHSGAGLLTVAKTGSRGGTVDAYGDATSPTPIISYTGSLTAGRLTDYASSPEAITDGCFNVRTSWTDINGKPETLTTEGETNGLWLYSSGGPTRDGRSPTSATYGGVDIATPGGNAFAAYSPTSYWGDATLFSFNLIQSGKGLYGRHSATSASAPIALGAAALLLQMDPNLTAGQIRQYLHESAVADHYTGTTPNQNWGMGKLNVLAAADMVAATFNTDPVLSPHTLTFPALPVGSTSAAKSVIFSNKGSATDALGITSVAASGDFHVTSSNCESSLPAGSDCTLKIVFKPTRTGPRKGTLTIKDFNVHSPHAITVIGTGN
jgi:minor extracellular serine protease Vpr